LGIVENMSYFICSKCNERHEIFSSGGAKKEAEKFETLFLGELPLDKNLRIYSDEGRPICVSDPESSIAATYLAIAKKVHGNLH
jgi:ATP-binding protein involved in chromosome partitioning